MTRSSLPGFTEELLANDKPRLVYVSEGNHVPLNYVLLAHKNHEEQGGSLKPAAPMSSEIYLTVYAILII